MPGCGKYMLKLLVAAAEIAYMLCMIAVVVVSEQTPKLFEIVSKKASRIVACLLEI